ncbi:glucosaminidase domain-containing protein [Ferruginivarius sediminum]|nr:glucosaminidase domain-containing protein [Ferruginivarius sediminum]
MQNVIALVAGERHERPKVLVSLLAAGALAAMVLAGGPGYWPEPKEAPSVAKLIRVEKVALRERLPRRDIYGRYRPTAAMVRIPDSAARVNAYFAAMNYHLPHIREGGDKVPRVYLSELPSGIKALAPAKHRKALFIRTVLPLVLKANEDIMATRRRILVLGETRERHGKLSDSDREWLLGVAARYQGHVETLDDIDMDDLLRRVDVVPPSLAVTQSILESGWGTSRFARKGNALFGQRTWNDDAPGLKPQEADGFKVRAFETLGASVRAYVHNLNTSKAYKALRARRARMRARGEVIDGFHLAGTLQHYSEEGWDYVDKLRGLMAHNGLRALDRSGLRPSIIAQRVVPDPAARKIRVALQGVE